MSFSFAFAAFFTFFSSLGFAVESSWILGKSSHTPGPNCWNAALVQVGVLQTHRFVHPAEFEYLLQKNCQLIAEPQKGSLGRMYDDTKEVHSFVWSDSQTIYAKHSDGTFDNRGYELMSMQDMLRSYLYKKECAMNQDGKGCKRTIEYYQCESPSGNLALQIEALQKAESLLHSLVFSSQTKMSHGNNCQSAVTPKFRPEHS